MVEKMALIKEQCGIEEGVAAAKAVAQANEILGIDNSGPLVRQVDVLMTELGLRTP